MMSDCIYTSEVLIIEKSQVNTLVKKPKNSSCYFSILCDKIIKLSVEKDDWSIVCNEWDFEGIELSVTGRCLCSHKVKDDYWIRNIFNGNKTHVGSRCIINFMRSNKKLIENVELAKYSYGKSICVSCKKVTNRNNRLHLKCDKEYRRLTYCELVKNMDYTKLNDYELNFVRGSVYKCITEDKFFTDKQCGFLHRIIMKASTI